MIIKKSVINAVEEMSYQLDGKKLMVVPNSPIAVILGSAFGNNVPGREGLNGALTAITHEQYEIVVRKLTDMVAGQVSLARNTINSLRKEIITDVKTSIDAAGDFGATYKFNQYEIPNLFNNENLAAELDKYRNSAMLTVEQYSTITKNAIMGGDDALSATEKQEIYSTFYNDLTEDLREYLDISAIQTLNNEIQAYPDTLADGKIAGDLTKSLTQSYFALAGIIAGNSDADVNDREGLLRARNFVARLLLESIERHVTNIKRGDIFVPHSLYGAGGYASMQKTVVVYTKNLKAWLNGVGSAEAIQGHLIANEGRYVNNKLPMDELSINLLIESYQAYMKRVETRTLLEGDRMKRDVLSTTFKKYIVDNYEDEERTELIERLTKYPLDTPYRKGNDFNHYVRDMVCEVLFPNQAAHGIICAVDAYMASTGETDAKKALPYAICDRMGSWLAEQFVVTE